MLNVIILDCFKRQLKKLNKKYPSLKGELIKELNNFSIQSARSLGCNNYKIRINVDEIQKGKSKSIRSIIHLVNEEDILVPIAIYFKGDKESISLKEVKKYLQTAIEELKSKDITKQIPDHLK